jgi:DNA-directed RNA polymerase specialized sigma24 family protein
MLRGKVSSYRVESFEDVVIFLHDVEHCMEKLEPAQRHLITRITLQEFTVGEVSVALGLDPRTVIRRHTRALDHLTRLFLEAEMLAPLNPPGLKRCQGGKS